jgi:hypothetical protein
MSTDSSLLNIVITQYLTTTAGQKFLRDLLTQTLTVPACEFEDEESTTCRTCGSQGDGLDDQLIEDILIPAILRGARNL